MKKNVIHGHRHTSIHGYYVCRTCNTITDSARKPTNNLKYDVHIASLVGIIEKQKQELTELRAWKEKARPLLLSLNSRLVQDMEMFPDCIPESFNKQKAILTELLGGGG